MPAIWNINNVYGSNNKKVSSKLTFEVGEKFSGRIAKSLDGKNEVMIKLSDGWQFAAEIDDDSSDVIEQEGLIRFQVEGFENGKLKLKVVGEKAPQGFSADDIIDNFLKGEGLSSEDKAIVEKLVKHNMRVSREEVLQLKSILNFHEKLQGDMNEGAAFIERYLLSKGIDINSEKGQSIKNSLEGFVQNFKDLSEAEVLIMLENGLDFSKESIESFKKLSKDFSGVEKNLKDIGNLIENEKQYNEQEIGQIGNKTIEQNSEPVEIDNEEVKNNIKTSNAVEADNEEVKTSDGQTPENKPLNNSTNDNSAMQRAIRSKALGEIYTTGNNKVNMLQLLKAMAASDNDILKYAIQDLLESKKSEFIFSGDLDKFQKKITSMDDETIIKTLSDECRNANVTLDKMTKNIAEDVMYKLLGKRVSISSKEFTKLQNIINFVMNENNAESLNNNDNNFNLNAKSIDIGSEQEVVNQEGNNSEINEIQGQTQKDVGINKGNTDSSNKNQTVQNSTISSKNESKNLSFDEKVKYNNPLDASAREDVPQTNQEAVKQQIMKHGEDLKLLIKDILKLATDGQNTNRVGKDELSQTELINNLKNNEKLLSEKVGEKVFDIIKNNISDFKIFNSLSNQYYCLNLPVTLKQREYPCKIIIKDDRENGKKVDSTNTKIVVTIKTGSLGEVDGYLKFKDKILNVDLKCEEKFIKPLNLGKANLEDNLRKLGFSTHIVVSKKIEEVTITSCREFFNDNNISAVNVTV